MANDHFHDAGAKTFFAGTYFPRHNRYGQPGLIELSQSIARLWKSDRESLLRYGDQIIAAITSQHNESGEPNRELMHSAYESLCRTFDRKWGGFGPAPKFPAPHVQYLEQAILRANQMLDYFEDENGGFFLTAHDAEPLIDRPKETYDGALPSGNSVAAMVLETLAQLTGETGWRKAADRQMRFMAGHAAEYPAGHCFALLAIEKALHPSRELIVCGEQIPPEILSLHQHDLNILFKSSANAGRLAACAPFTLSYPVPDHGSTGYLCENGACRKTDTDLRALIL